MTDKKLADLDAMTSTTGDDIIYVVDDPAGTPADKKVALDNLFKRGTAATSKPIIDASQTWDDGGDNTEVFTGLKLDITDTASSIDSMPINVTVAGTSLFAVRNDGKIALGYVTPTSDNFSVGSSGGITTLNAPESTGAAEFAVTGSPLVAVTGGSYAGTNGGLSLRMRSGMKLGWTNGTYPRSGTLDTMLTRRGTANINLGNADAASPVAQTLSVQSVADGTSNASGADFTIAGSQATGTGTAGNILFQTSYTSTTGTTQNDLATVATIGPNTLSGSQTTPVLDLAQVWNTSGNATGLKLNVTNTASGASSLLMDLGTTESSVYASRFKVGKNGNVTVTGATITADAPVLNLAQTWNAGAVTFTGLKFNATDTASASASLLMDLQVGTSSAFTISKGGNLKLGVNTAGTNAAGNNVTISGSQGTGTGAGGSIIFQVAPAGSSGTAQNALATALSISSAKRVVAGSIEADDGYLSFYTSTANALSRTTGERSILFNTQTTSNNPSILLNAQGTIGFTASAAGVDVGTAVDTALRRDAANTLALRNGTNAQSQRIYGSYTSASVYKRLALSSSTTDVTVAAETNTGDMDVVFTPAGTGNVKFGTHSAIAAETVTGYITIKDSGGTVRKLAVVS